MSGGGGLCKCCLKFYASLGVAALVLWLTYRPIKPHYYLVAFSLNDNATTLKPPSGDLTNVTLATFQLEIENKNRQMGIYHDDLAVSLSFGPGRAPVGGVAVIPHFYQGNQKTAEKPTSVNGSRAPAAPWAAVVANGSAVFRVGVESAFRYKVLAWKSRHHAVSLAGDVAVDAEGKKTAKKGIRLSSADPALAGYYAALAVTPLVLVVLVSC